MKPIIVVGDSHIVSIRRASKKLPDSEKSRIVFWPLGHGGAFRELCHHYEPLKGELTTIPPLRYIQVFSKDTISAVSPDAILAVSLPLNTSRILRDYSWHTHAPWLLAKKEFPLSDEMLTRMIDDDSVYALRFVKDLCQIWPHVVAIEGPRFFLDASYLRTARLDVCQYVDKTYRERVTSILRTQGIDVIAQPPVTITKHGTTSLQYNHPDPEDDHHANRAYGKLVIADLFRYANEISDA